MTANTRLGCEGNIYSSIYISIYTCVSQTDGLVVTDSLQARSCVCQVPGGSVTRVRGRRCRLVGYLIVGNHIALARAKGGRCPAEV